MTAKEAPALPRIVELLRVSGQGQADRDTPQDQRNDLDRLRDQYPGTLVERIESGAIRAVSGAANLNDRPDLKRLAELARARAFDELRVRHLDRLTRHTDPRERFAIFGMVQDAGAIIRDASGHTIDPASEIGEVDYFLQTWMASKERKRIRERTLTARHRLSEQGIPMTTIPYGRTYDRGAKTWGIDEREASVYRRIFEDIIAGRSLYQVADALTSEGVPPPRGGKAWQTTSISQMVRAPSAIGKMTSYGHPIACPPIVDEATQRQASDTLRRGAVWSGPKTVVHEALLRKVATCSCGLPMHVTPGGTKGVLYYHCAANRRRTAEGDCHKYHRVDQVDAAVKDALRPVLADPAALLEALKRQTKEGGETSKVDEVRADLADLAKREEKLVRLASKGMMSEGVYEQQAAEVAKLRQAAESRLSVALAQAEAAERRQVRSRDIEAALADAHKTIERDDFAGWRRVVQLLFPAAQGCTVVIRPDSQVDMDGLLPIGQPSSGTSTTARLSDAVPVRVRVPSSRRK